MAQRRRACGIWAAALLLQACASPGVRVQQTLSVETPGCPQARCTLSNDLGTWEVPATPGTVTVTTSHVALTLACRAPDGVQGRSGAASALGPSGQTGTLVGGAIGTGVGLAAAAPAMAFIPQLGVLVALVGTVVGAGSGQAIESQRRAIRYPDTLTVPMNCGAAAPAGTAPAAPPRATLGLSILGLLPAQGLAAGIGERGAVLVTEVRPGGPAEAAGLQPGDIVLAARGRALADAAEFERIVTALGAGEALTLRLWRQGRELERVLLRPATPL